MSGEGNEYVDVFTIFFHQQTQTHVQELTCITYIGSHSDMTPSSVSCLEDGLLMDSLAPKGLVGSKSGLVRTRGMTGRGQPGISACSSSVREGLTSFYGSATGSRQGTLYMSRAGRTDRRRVDQQNHRSRGKDQGRGRREGARRGEARGGGEGRGTCEAGLTRPIDAGLGPGALRVRVQSSQDVDGRGWWW